MRRYFALFFFVLTAALRLSACGGTPAPAPTAAPTEAPTAAPTEAPTPEPTEAPTPEPTAAPTPTPAPTEEPAPTEAPTPEPPAAEPVPAGTYVWKSPDGEWRVQLRDDGLFTLTDPNGGIHTGEGWDTDPDGTVICGPTDIYSESFAFNGGCSRWVIEGKTCHPAEEAHG